MVKKEIVLARAKELEKAYNLSHYEILQRFIFERILERISISQYQDNFILKGGLLLSAMFGVNNRTTKDMDTTISGIDIKKEEMLIVLNRILSINIQDNVSFEILNITNIRENNKYGGNKYHIIGKFDNLKINVEIDISTGDKVTPNELKYKFPLLFENRSILLNSYNIETIFSEKFETLLRRGRFNSRMKDFYDIFFFLNYLINDIDINILKQDLNNTFNKRNSINYLKDYNKILDSVLNSKKVQSLWDNYSLKNQYANNISLLEIIELLHSFINELEIDAICV
ncbi:MAG: nucleotidyl transferase AbiEii/AbiGii toxin family protein [Bacilli bacterium]